MGGRASAGEWQVELAPISMDPRDATRQISGQASVEGNGGDGSNNPFLVSGRPPIEASPEEYPALGYQGLSAMTVGGWSNLSNHDRNKHESNFPSLKSNNGGGGVSNVKSNDKSFAKVANTGISMRAGKVGGASGKIDLFASASSSSIGGKQAEKKDSDSTLKLSSSVGNKVGVGVEEEGNRSYSPPLTDVMWGVQMKKDKRLRAGNNNKPTKSSSSDVLK